MPRGCKLSRDIHEAGNRVLTTQFCPGCFAHLPAANFVKGERHCTKCRQRRASAQAAIRKRSAAP
jgi:hypothetical protein